MKKTMRVIILALAFLCSAPVAGTNDPNLRLVVQITVDQLRGDIPARFAHRFVEGEPGGFRYLLEHGLVFANAHFAHATTFTALGHATLVTGGYTAQHGIAGNDWYDPVRGKRVYAVEDPDASVLRKQHGIHEGSSPRNLTSTTLGDELVSASGGQSRVFAVSGKNRAAILTGGHLGKAFWYWKDTGEFVTSDFYYDEYPAWVAKWNAARPANRFRNTRWQLIDDPASYLFLGQDDRPFERSYKSLGRTFPHVLNHEEPAAFYSQLRFTPMQDELVLEFAEALVRGEQLGTGEYPDYLSLSFSATDLIGHAFGPNSLEAEDNILRLDRTLARLFAFLDQQVGLDKTLVVLSSDHGICAAPEYSSSKGFDAGRLDPPALVADLNARLRRNFDIDIDLVAAFYNPSLYLDLAALARTGLPTADVERALVNELRAVPGIAMAISRTDLLRGAVPSDPIGQRVLRAFHPRRTGHVVIVQEQLWYLHTVRDTYTAMHGSPYSYDTFVPIMFAGPGVPAGKVHRAVGPEDIAPTLAAYLGIQPPSGSMGRVLTEVLQTPETAGDNR